MGYDGFSGRGEILGLLLWLGASLQALRMALIIIKT
jgi:hypothetical protein